MKQRPSLPEMPSTDSVLHVRHLGSCVPYGEGMAYMRDAMARVGSGAAPELILLEHEDTITTTRQHGVRSFILPQTAIEERGIRVVETDRGGDVTFHGAGQLVGYLVMRLEPVDLIAYLRALESSLLRAMLDLGLRGATTMMGNTGIWILQPDGSLRKLIAIGVGVSKGVTRHGFALNRTTDLEKFTDCIVPCGLNQFGVTSLARELAVLPSETLIIDFLVRAIKASFRLQ